MSYDPGADFGRLRDEAQRAPSIFNNKPWYFEPPSTAHPERIELWLRAVNGPMNKARAREYVISCGAALFNLRLAIRAAGHDLVVWLLPDPNYAGPLHPPTLLAWVEIVTGRIKKPRTWEQGLYASIEHRRTNRQPYRIIPAPLPIIAEMEAAAAQEGAYLRLLHGHEARKWMREAAKVDHRNPPFAAPFPDLVSSADYGPLPDNPRYPPTRKDFWIGKKQRFEHPQLMALSTDDDTTVDWLRAGQALERAILTGTCYSVSERYGLTARYHAPHRDGFPARRHLLKRDELACHGLSASYLTQPLEAKDMDSKPRGWPSRWRFAELPQMIIRVGYAADGPDDQRKHEADTSGKKSQRRREPLDGLHEQPETGTYDEGSQPRRKPPAGAQIPVSSPKPTTRKPAHA